MEILKTTIKDIFKEVGSSVDGWDLKKQIFNIFTYKYISEDFEKFIKQNYGVDYSSLDDNDEFIKRSYDRINEFKGYFIKPSYLFNKYTNSFTEENAYDKINRLFELLNLSTTGNLIDAFENYDLGALNKSHVSKAYFNIVNAFKKIISPIDAGTLYETLTNEYFGAGKTKGGEYYTPNDLSELLVTLVLHKQEPKELMTVYDPTCGTGSLLLKYRKYAFNLVLENKPTAIKLLGQEINPSTFNLCRVNALINGLSYYSDFHFEIGDTLLEDRFENHKFDTIISNPPYSLKWVGKDKSDLLEDPRFKDIGVLAPKNAADWAFISHCLYHLKDDGLAAIIAFPGTLYRDRAEKEIRKYFVENNYIDTIIQLTDRLFWNTTISVCILILNKNKEDDTVKFVDASEIYTKRTKKNILSIQNQYEILKLCTEPDYDKNKVYIATKEEIRERDYNLTVSNYIPEKKTEDNFDPIENAKLIKKSNQKIREYLNFSDNLNDAIINGEDIFAVVEKHKKKQDSES